MTAAPAGAAAAPSSGPGPARGVRTFAVVAAVCGAAVTIVEFAALRRLAPAYGQTVFTWANDVAVVLLFLAAGSVLGGVLADRARTTTTFYRCLQWGAFWLALAATVGWMRLEEWLPLSRSDPAIGFWSSLAAAAIAFGPPMLVLGMVAPFYVRRASAGGNAGRAAGRIYAAGTVGSLVGCYVTPFWLLPSLGTTTTLLVAAGLGAGACVFGYFFDAGFLALPPAGVSPEPAAAPAPRGRGRLRRMATPLALAFVAGFATLVLEFGAVRLLAPWFGQSVPVWANAVGVVLLALAIGAALGGRLADGAGSARPAGLVLALAAAWTLLLAVAGPAVARFLAPIDLSVDRALPLSFWGSLAATTVLVGPPCVLLGAVPPLAVREATAPGERGRAAGLVFAAGTLGSLVATFAGPLALLGTLGSRRTALLCAALLAAAGVAFAATRRPRLRVATLASAAVLAAAVVGGIALDPTLRRDPGQLAEVETAYQTVRVVESRVELPHPARTRFLGFDEDVGSYQSVLVLDPVPGAPTLERYYDHLALGAWFQGMPWAGRTPSAPRVLVVGYAGGTLHRALDAVSPPGLEPRVVGVEIDPRVVDIARDHLALRDLETDRLRLLAGEDGRSVVAALEDQFHVVYVDAFQRTQYVPFHLATVEFFRACRRRLAPGGVVGMNVTSEHGISGSLVRAIASSLREALREGSREGEVFLVPNPSYPGNVAVWGTLGPPPRVASGVPAALAGPAYALDLLLVRHTSAEGGLVLTDDRAPTERLADEALLGGAAQ